jgi:hypothetical protein
MSSTLQTEKTKADAKSLANDAGTHASHAADSIKTGAHKVGVALGVSEKTPGEKIGKGIEKGVDVMTGDRNHV